MCLIVVYHCAMVFLYGAMLCFSLTEYFSLNVQYDVSTIAERESFQPYRVCVE